MREHILQKAEYQLKQGGYESLNFGQIAEELETTRANLHYHFKNKETLALEVTRLYVEQREADLKKMVVENRDDFVSFLLRLEDYFWGIVKQQGLSTCVCSQLMKSPHIPETLTNLARQHMEFILGLFQQIVQGSIDSGKLSKDRSAQVLSVQASAMIAGIANMAHSFDDASLAEGHLRGVLSDWALRLKSERNQ